MFVKKRRLRKHTEINFFKNINMKIAIIGSTGFVGPHLVKESLLKDHTVTAISRNAEKQSLKDEHLNYVSADVFNTDHLASILKGHDAVISAFNAGWQNPNLYNDFIAGSKSIQEAVKRAGVKRYIVIGGAGSLEIKPGLQLVDSPTFPNEWKAGATAARDYLNILKEEKELDWTFVSPAIEMHPGTSGKRSGIYRTAKDSPVFDQKGKSIIAVEDLAVAVLDELENNTFIKQRFTVAY
jgi:uncharacterized protein